MLFKHHTAVLAAILAAILFGVSTPVSKMLLAGISPALMAALLYLGAGAGVFVMNLVRRARTAEQTEARITAKEIPFVVAMIVLDIAAPLCLMIGLTMTSAAGASLLSNFEIVATSVVALLFFREPVGKRLWLAIILITLSSFILSVEDLHSFSFSFGSLFVILACICWGFENNCSRMLSIKNPMQVVIIKGFGSGSGALIIAFALNELSGSAIYIAAALILGFFSYGLSIFFYVSAQRELGAARTSAYYAFAPFAGVGLSFLLFRETPTLSFAAALFVMIAGTYLAFSEEHRHPHTHAALTHEHRHNHEDGHHNHMHNEPVPGEHNHIHTHEDLTHAHHHTPDAHHIHTH